MDANKRTNSLVKPHGQGLFGARSPGALGFTVVELITVILLLAILSAVAISKMVKPSAFAPSVVSHQLTLELNLAQSMATARQDTQVSMEVLAGPATWQLRTSTTVDGLIRDTAVDAANGTITISDGSNTAPISTSDTLVLAYSGRGSIASAHLGGVALDATQGIEFNVIGDSSRTLCLYPTGFLDAATCS